MSVRIDQKDSPPHAHWLRDIDSGEWIVEIPADFVEHAIRLQGDAYAAGQRDLQGKLHRVADALRHIGSVVDDTLAGK